MNELDDFEISFLRVLLRQAIANREEQINEVSTKTAEDFYVEYGMNESEVHGTVMILQNDINKCVSILNKIA